jgi:ABC transporter related protein
LLLAATLAVHPEIIVLDEPVSAMDPDGAHSLYELLYAIHQRYGTTIIVVEHRVDYLLPYVTDMVVLKEGQLVTADTFAAAARTMYEDEELRPLVPALWQVKLGVERRFGITLGEWRTEAEAAAELQMLGFEGGNA